MGSEASIPIRVPLPGGASPEPAALASAAHALCDAGRTMEAETIARWLVHQHPHFSGARIVLGRVLFEQERLEEAADLLRATTIQYPASVAAYRWLAEVLVRQGLWARAKAVLHQAAMLSPANGRISQLQKLAGQSVQRSALREEDSTTRAMSLATRVPPPLPPIPAQGLSRKERHNQLSEEDPTPAGVAPPETPLYARAGFVPDDQAYLEEDALCEPEESALALRPRRDTLKWPAPTPFASALVVPNHSEGPVIHVLPHHHQRTTMDITAVEPTPSVVWKGVPLLDHHWRRRWHRGAVLAAGLLATASVGFLGLRWLLVKPLPSLVPPSSDVAENAGHQAAMIPPTVSAALHLGTPASLREAALRGQKMGGAPGLVVTQLAEALLMMDYGFAPSQRADQWPSELEGALADAAVAARSIRALADGQIAEARTLAQGAQALDPQAVWLPLAQARLQQRLGNLDAAKENLSAALADGRQVISLLAAELAIDDGKPHQALELLVPLSTGTARHPRVESLIDEAEEALHADRKPTVVACSEADGTNVWVSCTARAASRARRSGHREQALRLAQRLRAGNATDPRALAHAIVTSANLGMVAQATQLDARLKRLVSPSFGGRAWSDLALAMAKGPVTANAEAPGRATSAEGRLLAVRTAFARGGTMALSNTLAALGDSAIGADEDLRWWRLLTRYSGAEAMQVSSKLMRSQKSMGAVGAFVAGLLAENSRRLTSHWMGKAVADESHADRCWAAAEFAQAQHNLGEDPNRLAAYRNLAASGTCN